MKPHLVFCHGWGLDRHYWDNLLPLLSDPQRTIIDLGYFGTPQALKKAACRASMIGIGHSLGLIKLLSLNLPFKAFIGLNGFVNFLGRAPDLHRHRQRAWTHLYQNFIKDAEKTLLSFYQECGFYNPYRQDLQGVQMKKLQQDLKQLRTALPLPLTTPLLILGAEDDSIVPPALLEDNFAPHPHLTTRLLSQGGHLLGYHQPGTIVPLIRDFIDAL